ncbi:DUF4183 domain-containing protein [Sporosarcina sp. HYO08]|uniref:DUF4183 domain-containing protein n=1 Tax=Sporosarcina sp. HYO08 TaxID=1759557 RepID=UPI0007948C43|nr:DUF4183 domain-containing protein [Sporosarcina sp. HYO08]KXH80637.1 hypothetical protein AU377_07780 [Sporosarcina sp. HYO08]
MALSLMNINVNVTGGSARFFNVLSADLAVAKDVAISAADFVDDMGNDITEFPAATNGYYNFYINGVLQEDGSYNITTTELTFNDVTGTLTAGTPLIVQVVSHVTTV